jgi:broad specificity phosphatase PhoE
MTVRRPAAAPIAALLLLLSGLAADAQQPAPPTTQTGTLRIYLARHGQTDGNATGLAQGFTDTALNATGREQAAQLAESLTGVQLDAIYSSTLSRSRETAETVAAGRPVRSLPDLREMNLGRFEGRKIGDPEMQKRRGGPDNPDDGESGPQFFERVSGAVKGILAQHRSGTILIVGHGGTNGQILRALLSPPPGTKLGTQSNDELYLIEIDAGVPPRVFKFLPMNKLGEL